MVFTIIQFYFCFWSAYSGQSIFDDWYITFYNLVFTALPLIIRASFDQDVNYKIDPKLFKENTRKNFLCKTEQAAIKNNFPNLYYVGQRNTIFNIQSFVVWILQGALHGLIIYYLT